MGADVPFDVHPDFFPRLFDHMHATMAPPLQLSSRRPERWDNAILLHRDLAVNVEVPGQTPVLQQHMLIEYGSVDRNVAFDVIVCFVRTHPLEAAEAKKWLNDACREVRQFVREIGEISVTTSYLKAMGQLKPLVEFHHREAFTVAQLGLSEALNHDALLRFHQSGDTGLLQHQHTLSSHEHKSNGDGDAGYQSQQLNNAAFDAYWDENVELDLNRLRVSGGEPVNDLHHPDSESASAIP